MSIDISEVSFKITDNRWLEIHVGEQEVLSIDAIDGGVELCPSDSTGEIGNLVANEYGTFKFEPAGVEEPEPEQAPEQEGGFRVVYTPPVLERILATLERIEQKL